MPAPQHEPHKFKTIRNMLLTTLEERKGFLHDAYFNTHLLLPSQVTFDLCSFGTSAESQEMMSGYLIGDEAYAGARNFDELQRAVREILGKSYVCPTHNFLGSIKLIMLTMVKPECIVVCNSTIHSYHVEHLNVNIQEVRTREHTPFTGDMDLKALEKKLQDGKVAFVAMQSFADGQHPFCIRNLRAVRSLSNRYGVKLGLNMTLVIENAVYIQRFEESRQNFSIADIVLEISKTADFVYMDASASALCKSGGLIATDNPEDFEVFMNEVVVYEGLHTYGGMSGRTMEVFARGLREMANEDQAHWIFDQAHYVGNTLLELGIPLERGCDGAYIRCREFFPNADDNHQNTFSAALYLMSGIRTSAVSTTGMWRQDEALVPVAIPRMTLVKEQLDFVINAVVSLHKQREKVISLKSLERDVFSSLAKYEWASPVLEPMGFQGIPPYVVTTIERVGMLTKGERQRAMERAGWNTFLLRSEDVTIDLLTDSGTTAMSTNQWAAFFGACASPCITEAFKMFEAAAKDVFGYEYIFPTHQGRAAEHILSQAMIKPGQIVPGNMYFTTTKVHQELAGGEFVDIIVDEAHDSLSEFQWKGNCDLAKMAQLVETHGAEKIAYISFEMPVNLSGGQPASMDNIKEVYEFCQKHHIPVFFDATRAVENAYFIQKYDQRYSSLTIKEIMKQMMQYGDGATISGKKDFLVNIGGALLIKDNAEWASRCRALLGVFEGSVFNGGLAPADVAAMAVGIREMVDDAYIASRVEQTRTLGMMLKELGVPIILPPGGHAIFVDAKRFLPHIDQEEFPAQRLAAEIYIETGVRAMERGNVSKGRKPNGENYRPALELVRLTIPRRVYSNQHMRAVAEGIAKLLERRQTIAGLKFVYEPQKLRFFQARFASL